MAKARSREKMLLWGKYSFQVLVIMRVSAVIARTFVFSLTLFSGSVNGRWASFRACRPIGYPSSHCHGRASSMCAPPWCERTDRCRGGVEQSGQRPCASLWPVMRLSLMWIPRIILLRSVDGDGGHHYLAPGIIKKAARPSRGTASNVSCCNVLLTRREQPPQREQQPQ